MRDDHAIRQLVRETLGCSCPEAVFEHIERIRQQQPTRAQPYNLRLVIGGRLLIYLLGRASLESGQVRLADILTVGRDERDAHGYNRFRAVLCDSTDADAQASLHAEWQRLATGDERVHLHLVDPQSIASLTADP